MKTFLTYSTMLVIAVLALAGCGKSGKTQNDGENTLILKPATTEISGEMEGCFTVVERDYKVKMEEFVGGVITVELKRTDESLPFSTDGIELYHFGQYSSSRYVQVGFGIEFLDEDGNIVSKIAASSSGLGGPYSPDECVALVKLSEGKTGSIRFSVDDEAKSAVTFRISSAYTYGGSDEVAIEEVKLDENKESGVSNAYEPEENANESTTINSRSSSGSTNWDSVLDSYERFVDKYIGVLKRIKSGSLTTTSPEYLNCLQEAAEFNSKVMNAEGDLSSEQIMRLNKIVQKLTPYLN